MKPSLDMTSGKPMPLLIRFTLPTLAGNLLHQAYSITDSVVVGRYLGQTALAAVGCTAPIVMLLAALMVGVNVGVGVLISQNYGRKDFSAIRRSFVNSLYLSAAVAIVLAIVGGALAEPILRWMGTPDGPLRDAAVYLEINFATAVCPLFYYLFSSVFRGMGDSKTALYCLIVASLANIGLDILFVGGFHWGVAGSAWATALSQTLSAVFAAILLRRKYPEAWPGRGDLAWDRRLFSQIATTALPIALQSAFNNLSNLAAQAGVNTFGEAVMAAYTAASRIGTLALLPVETIGSSLSVYAGQNHGAGKSGRVRSGIRAALVLALIVSTVMAAVLLACGGTLSRLFLTQPSEEVLSVVSRYLLITSVPGILAGVMHVYQQSLRGVGRSGQAMFGGLMQLAAKIAAVAVGAWVMHNLDVVWLGWPLSFAAGAVFPYFCMRSYLRKNPSAEENPTRT